MRRADLAALILLCGLGLGVLAPGLAHPMIVSWDEGAHQIVTRSFYETGKPMIYRDPLVTEKDGNWYDAHIFLHKPPLPFMLGAVFMHFTGVTPLALRLVSLLSALLIAAVISLFARRDLGRFLGISLAAAFLVLPFGWNLVQGTYFGDATDCALVGFLSLSFFLLARAAERRSTRDACLSGAACGAAFLCKSALALCPAGAALALVLLHATGLSRGLSARQLFLFLLMAAVVALPYNAYCAFKWPSLFFFEANHTLSHLGEVFPWGKPIDALFNDIGVKELGVAPMAFFLLAGLWLARVAVRERSTRAWVALLWLWGEWLPLSYATSKVPAVMWGAVPAMLIAAGYLLSDAARSPPLAGAAAFALCSPAILRLWPSLSLVRRAVPDWLPDTHDMPGLAEGLALAAMGAALGAVWIRFLRRNLELPGTASLIIALFVLLVLQTGKLRSAQAEERERFAISFSQDIGQALDRSLPEHSVLFLDVAGDPPCCFEKSNLMFWSGRMVYPIQTDLLDAARRRGYHPYLVASVAEPYERLPFSPAGAWLQAFDLDKPGMPELPTDLKRGGQKLLGVGIGSSYGNYTRYAIYLKGPVDDPIDLSVEMGKLSLHTNVAVSSGLEMKEWTDKAPWFEIPLIGPAPNGTVSALGETVRLGAE